jgi:hypothetical protein
MSGKLGRCPPDFAVEEPLTAPKTAFSTVIFRFRSHLTTAKKSHADLRLFAASGDAQRGAL